VVPESALVGYARSMARAAPPCLAVAIALYAGLALDPGEGARPEDVQQAGVMAAFAWTGVLAGYVVARKAIRERLGI
jgi:hypothetical protein